MTGIAGPLLPFRPPIVPYKERDPLTGIDIEQEYQLIQEKRSSLTRSQRDMVIFRYNQIHKKPSIYA